MIKRACVTARLLVAVVIACGVLAPAAAAQQGAQHSLRSPVTDENFYFVMADRFENGSTANDKGGLSGRLPRARVTRPTARGFYHGGDLRGIIRRLDYIEGLGTTSIWLTPSFKNQPVQRPVTAERPAVGGLSRLLGHRLHADRPASRHQRRPRATSSTPRTRAA